MRWRRCCKSAGWRRPRSAGQRLPRGHARGPRDDVLAADLELTIGAEELEDAILLHADCACGRMRSCGCAATPPRRRSSSCGGGRCRGGATSRRTRPSRRHRRRSVAGRCATEPAGRARRRRRLARSRAIFGAGAVAGGDPGRLRAVREDRDRANLEHRDTHSKTTAHTARDTRPPQTKAAPERRRTRAAAAGRRRAAARAAGRRRRATA